MLRLKKRKIHIYRIGSILIYSLLFFLIKLQISTIQAKEQKYDFPYPKILIKLAKSLDMEPIEGEEFLYSLRKNNGQGLPYVFSETREIREDKISITHIILFWCQKGGEKYLIYAINEPQKNGQDYNYIIKGVISSSELFGHDHDGEFSYGLIVYDGILGITKDLSYFSYLDDSNEYGPKNVYPIRLSGFLPLIIYQKNDVVVLYHYKDRWLKYVKLIPENY